MLSTARRWRYSKGMEYIDVLRWQDHKSTWSVKDQRSNTWKPSVTTCWARSHSTLFWWTLYWKYLYLLRHPAPTATWRNPGLATTTAHVQQILQQVSVLYLLYYFSWYFDSLNSNSYLELFYHFYGSHVFAYFSVIFNIDIIL